MCIRDSAPPHFIDALKRGLLNHRSKKVVAATRRLLWKSRWLGVVARNARRGERESRWTDSGILNTALRGASEAM
eukprot:5829174-Alexandrium_andersonii.AAC.1